jgi:hypothetical protein
VTPHHVVTKLHYMRTVVNKGLIGNPEQDSTIANKPWNHQIARPWQDCGDSVCSPHARLSSPTTMAHQPFIQAQWPSPYSRLPRANIPQGKGHVTRYLGICHPRIASPATVPCRYQSTPPRSTAFTSNCSSPQFVFAGIQLPIDATPFA